MARGGLREMSEGDRYRLLLGGITDYAIYMLDAQGHVSSWNPGAERFKGYTADEILGEHFSRFHTPEDRAAGLPVRALATAESEGRFEGEGWRVRKDGTRFWAHVVIDPIRTDGRELIGFAKITRDLTERREREEALRRTERQFRLLVEGVTDYAIYMLDREGRVASWNGGARRIKGYEPDEVIGTHVSRFYTEEDRAAGRPARALATALAEGRFESEGWRVRKDGSRFWASVVVDAIRDDAGRHLGFAKVTRDITERREAQQALERAQEELLQSRKLEALGQLAGGVAHDFNNLLMAISGSLDLLDRRVGRDNPSVERLIRGARRAVERGTSLTGRMLAFSRRQPLESRPVDLVPLIGGLEGLLRLTVGDAVALELEVPARLPPALTDPGQLELALINVAANARDAMPEGGRLRIALDRAEVGEGEVPGLAAGRFLRLTLADTGHGMDAGTLRRAAEPFFTTKGPGRGTGLGLSVVHGFLRDSGGRLALESREGKGTAVTFWLPEAPPPGPAAADAGGDGAAAGPLPPLVVLAVDDDDLVLEGTVALLEELGLRPIPARGGAEALARLAEGDVDLVVTDHGMPGMTGTELADRLRESHPGLPVILVTGYVDRGARAPRPDLTRPDLTRLDLIRPDLPRLDKPFGLDDLRRAVARAVGADPAAGGEAP